MLVLAGGHAKWLMCITSSNPHNSIIGKLPEAKRVDGMMKRVEGVKYKVTEGD